MSAREKPKATVNTIPKKKYAIYPGVGIARVGNSPNEFFIGPESPDQIPKNFGGYKDGAGRVKRQAARFRIYELDKAGNPVKEITHHDANIEWRVHMANKKCAHYLFKGRFNKTTDLRNPTIQSGMPPSQRTDLIIDAGVKHISGIRAASVKCEGMIKFDLELPIHVKIGELKTDDFGRLLVLGGHGFSASAKPNQPITNYANNDYWYDDTADGKIFASITLADGNPVEAEPATVLVTPPNFAPEVKNIITLYDVMHQVAVQKNWLKHDSKVEFYRDIYPILESVSNLSWVNNNAHRGHGPGRPADFLSEKNVKILSDKSKKSASARQAVFNRIRKPHELASAKEQKEQACLFYMPQLSGDDGDAVDGLPKKWLTVLVSQYEKLEKWAKGEFTCSTRASMRPISLLDASAQAHSLDRAALEPCVGGPFYPGIEMTYIAADKDTYKSAFRLADSFEAGDITCYMAMPWQADFYECNTHWWPAQRPDEVVPMQEYESVNESYSSQANTTPYTQQEPEADATGEHLPWARGLRTNPSTGSERPGDEDMVRYWHELGFVTPKVARSGETIQVETERTVFAGMDTRNLFYQLMNDSKEVLPKARQFAEQALENARAYMHNPTSDEIWRFFNYTPENFKARLNEIYDDMVNSVDRYDPATDTTFRNKADVVERIKQFSPFNMSDGCWLRHLAKSGPMDDPHSLLFSVLMDEMGDGVTAHNHSNIYRDLCHSTGFYPKAISSREFANDPSLIDSAFDLPVFELSISSFTEDFFPELLGMTLQLEWGIYEAKNTISLLDYYGFDPHYYIMHVGIDNPSNGHAARAVEAIGLYLDTVRAEGGGESAVQAQWERIWAGYVAFGTIGTFGQDLQNHLRDKPTLHEQMVQLIVDKSEYGSLNHGDKMLGDNRINDWFSDPEGFIKEIVRSGLVIPGDWDASPMKTLTSFSEGRMYRVFTPSELVLWQDWTNSLTKSIPKPVSDAQRNMLQLVAILRQRQNGSESHKVMTLRDPATNISHPISWWFQQPSQSFLAALCDPQNKWIVPGQPEKSPFLTELLAPARPMGAAFAEVIAGTGGKTGREIVTSWILDQCPTPKVTAKPAKVLWLSTSQADWDAHPHHKILGMGAIH